MFDSVVPIVLAVGVALVEDLAVAFAVTLLLFSCHCTVAVCVCLGLRPRNQGLEPLKHLVPWRPCGDVSPFNPPPPCADRYAPHDKVAMSLTHKVGATSSSDHLSRAPRSGSEARVRRPAVHRHSEI